MYYELYIDVFFLLNFMMDDLLLLLVRRVTRGSASRIRIALGAGVGAGLTSLVVALPFQGHYGKPVIFHVIITYLMVRIGLGIKSLKETVCAILLLYVGGVFMGGILSLFLPCLRVTGLFYGIAVVSYFIIGKLWSLLMNKKRSQNDIFRVCLYSTTRSCSIHALMDTGNCLQDPITGKAVHIVEINHENEKFFQTMHGTIRYIPYTTISSKSELLPIIKIEKMCVYTHEKKELWVQKPLIGLCIHPLSEHHRYTMILNSDLS